MHKRVPYETLISFQKYLGLNEEELKVLASYGGLFAKSKDEFAEHFYNFFYQIPRARVILEHERQPGFLKQIWADWFGSIFGAKLGRGFFDNLWRSGLRHVEINLDQRFVNLGYCEIRQFCHRIVCTEVPLSSRASVSLAVTRLLDLCLLTETNAYMIATAQCDREVIRGISHQIRNPITVIGGNARRLMKRFDPKSPFYRAFESLLMESKRLERLVTDIGEYIDTFQSESGYAVVRLEEIVSRAIERIPEERRAHCRLEIELDPLFPDVQGDPEELETMFFYLLENSFEAVSPEDPLVRITSKGRKFTPHFLQVEIFNTGVLPPSESVDALFIPFHSSKPTGTGFGLSIAKLAARKNLASLRLLSVPGGGVKCIIRLPVPAWELKS